MRPVLCLEVKYVTRVLQKQIILSLSELLVITKSMHILIWFVSI